MPPRRWSAALLTSLGCFGVSLDATAHISLDAPKSRYHNGSVADQNKLKLGPCGVSKDSRTANASLVTTFKPGERITVRFRETVQHPGYFRIAFDSDGQDFTLPGSATNGDGVTILADKIPDKSGGSNLEYTSEVTLPNIECSKCTLQLVQVMTTDPPPYKEGNGQDLYFNCADLILKGDGNGTGGSSSGGSSSGGAGSAGGGASTSSGGAPSSSGNAGATAGGAAGAGRGGSESGGQNSATSGGAPGSGGGGTEMGGATTSGGSAATGGATGAGGASSPSGSPAGGALASGGGTAVAGSTSDEVSDDAASGCSFHGGRDSDPKRTPWLLLGVAALLRRRINSRTRR